MTDEEEQEKEAETLYGQVYCADNPF